MLLKTKGGDSQFLGCSHDIYENKRVNLICHDVYETKEDILILMLRS